jgi:winged helix-turn-helix protein DUF2582
MAAGGRGVGTPIRGATLQASPDKQSVGRPPGQRTPTNTRTLPEACQRRATTAEEMEDVMDTEIGEVAGRIWRYLAQHGEATLRQLQKGTTLPERPLLIDVGWPEKGNSASSRRTGR